MLTRGWSIASFALCAVLLAGCGSNSGEGGGTYNCTQHCGSSSGATNPFNAASESDAEAQCVEHIVDCAQTKNL